MNVKTIGRMGDNSFGSTGANITDSINVKISSINLDTSETSSVIDIEEIAEPSHFYRLPEDLPQSWREIVKLEDFNEDVRHRVIRLMDKNKDCLSLHEYDSGITDLIEFEIVLKNNEVKTNIDSLNKG